MKDTTALKGVIFLWKTRIGRRTNSFCCTQKVHKQKISGKLTII